MKANNDPMRLDVAALAAAGGELTGRWPVARLLRLAEMSSPAPVERADDVVWTVRGEQHVRHAAPPEIWLHLSACARIQLTCQRCLAPVEQVLEVDRPLRFVTSEAEAEALDAELEEDVLELSRVLNLIDLIEDELLLALPLVPMHERCPVPLVAPAADRVEQAAPAEHPFAVLKGWKVPKSGH